MKTALLAALILAAVAGAAAAKWTVFAGRPSSAAALACSADGKTVYAADLNDIWKSEDGGATWKKITPKDE